MAVGTPRDSLWYEQSCFIFWTVELRDFCVPLYTPAWSSNLESSMLRNLTAHLQNCVAHSFGLNCKTHFNNINIFLIFSGTPTLDGIFFSKEKIRSYSFLAKWTSKKRFSKQQNVSTNSFKSNVSWFERFYSLSISNTAETCGLNMKLDCKTWRIFFCSKF